MHKSGAEEKEKKNISQNKLVLSEELIFVVREIKSSPLNHAFCLVFIVFSPIDFYLFAKITDHDDLKHAHTMELQKKKK